MTHDEVAGPSARGAVSVGVPVECRDNIFGSPWLVRSEEEDKIRPDGTTAVTGWPATGLEVVEVIEVEEGAWPTVTVTGDGVWLESKLASPG